MKSLLAVLAAIFTLATIAEAALSPYYQSANEIQAIFNLPEVGEKLNPHEIIGIEKTRETYTISTRACSLPVTVKYLPLPADYVGPAEFELELGELVCWN